MDTEITHHAPAVFNVIGVVAIAAIGTIRLARTRVIRFAWPRPGPGNDRGMLTSNNAAMAT